MNAATTTQDHDDFYDGELDLETPITQTPRFLTGWMLWVEDGRPGFPMIRDGFYSTCTLALAEGLYLNRGLRFRVEMCVQDTADGEGGFTGGEGYVYHHGHTTNGRSKPGRGIRVGSEKEGR